MHVLDLVRRDRSGGVVDRARRWVNRPGIEAEVHVSGECVEKTRVCDLTVNWAHPGRLDPASITVALDGITVSRRISATVKAPFPRGSSPQILTADATFPDGRRAAFTRLLHGSYPESVEASLHSVPILAPAGSSDEEIAESLRKSGWPVKAIEKGGFEVVFVVEPGAFDAISSLSIASAGIPPTSPLQDAEAIHAVIANESLRSFNALPRAARSPDTPDRPERWLRRVTDVARSMTALRRLRTADAVAAAGYDLGGSPRRRAVVLISGPTRTDSSTFSPEQAAAYLEQTCVPLTVWRLASGAASDWPAGPAIPAAARLAAEIATLKKELERQRIVWLDGHVDPRRFDWPLPEGISIAGRDGSRARPSTRSVSEPEDFVSVSPVYAVAVDPRSSQTVYAGTSEGLRISHDGGATWNPVAMGPTGIEVYSLAFGLPEGELLVGSSGAIGRSVDRGQSWALVPTLAVFSFAVAPNEPKTALAATRGGLFRTADAGLNWTAANRGLERLFPVSVVSDPTKRDVFYAATAGKGIFRSDDAGQSWKPLGPELERTVVRSVIVDPSKPESLYAGTDGGVFASANGGRSWDKKSSGLPRSVVYALRFAPGGPARVFAGTSAGLFESRDRGASWSAAATLREKVAITSIDFDAAGRRIVLGTLGRGVLSVPLED